MLKKLKLCFKKILTFFVSLCLFLNLTLTGYITSYADGEAISQNPLFIPISTLVATVAVGSGIIAKNSADAIQAGNELVNNVVNNIKNTEIARKNADSNYVSPYKVINGQGQPEEPNDNNKNGKWVGLAGGTIASGEIWANKDMVSDIMRGVYDVKGYQEFNTTAGIVEKTNFVNQGSTSQIALQLAKISNSAVTQFDTFLHSDYWSNKDYSADDCIFWVTTDLSYIYRQSPIYPALFIAYIVNNEKFTKLNIKKNPFAVGTFSNNYGSSTNYYCDKTGTAFVTVNNDNVAYKLKYCRVTLNSRNANQDLSYKAEDSLSPQSEFAVNGWEPYSYTWLTGVQYAYSGYKWTIQSPFQFTNNVYNVEQTFDVNFPDWLQDSINLLNQNIAAVRLGIQSLNDPWNNTQTQVQSGTTPTNVINQYINNYENPGNIPDDEEEPDKPVVVPPAVEEPQPTNDYLGNFLLPESITTKFPFCIPFDVARCLRLFSTSQREAPKWECDLKYGSNTYHVVIDLSIFDDLASFIRPLEYIAFLVGLAVGTRSLMRG